MDDPKRGKRENYGLVGLAPVANGHLMVILDILNIDSFRLTGQKGIHIVIPVCIVSMLFAASKRNKDASILKASLGSVSMPFLITDNTTIPRTETSDGRKRLPYEGGEEKEHSRWERTQRSSEEE
jgi:hypothetical protein